VGFGLLIFVIYWTSQSLSKLQDSTSGGLIPKESVATLVEYSDFQCPACGLYYPFVKQLKEEMGDKLAVVYKHFPLRTIHKNADLAARASEAARLQGRFWEMHNMIFEKQKEWSDSDQVLSLMTAYAVSLRIDQDRFLADINSNTARDRIDNDYQEGMRLGVRGTPTFFLNGKKIINPRSYDEFKSIVEQSIRR